MRAAKGAGFFDSVEAAACAMSGGGRVYLPDRERGLKYDRFYEIYKTAYPSLRDQFRQLQDAIHDTA